MRHVLSALVTNQPGVLAHIAGMLASRAFNIDSLAVGVTEDLEFSRITFVVNGDVRVLDQVRKQLEKIVTVVKVLDFSNRNYVERDLMLIKVSTDSGEDVSARSVKERISRMIEAEDKTKPLSDQEIADILCRESLRIARRTVAKYRDQLRINSQRYRKTL